MTPVHSLSNKQNFKKEENVRKKKKRDCIMSFAVIIRNCNAGSLLNVLTFEMNHHVDFLSFHDQC